ncbi:MAG: hypothetical protein WC971_06895 [Coriobacteriia bacterium]
MRGDRPDSDRRARRDIRYLGIDFRCVRWVLRYRPDPATMDASGEPADLLGRVERELKHEASRYRGTLWATIAVLLMPGVVAMALWMFQPRIWATYRVAAYETGGLGIPGFSLYTLISYVMLVWYLAFALLKMVGSYGSTTRLSADYRRLTDADVAARGIFASVVREGGYPRTLGLLERSAEFAAYREALRDAEGA